MAVAVVILSPDEGCEQIIQGCNRRTPCNAIACVKPLRMLVEHRVDDMNKYLLAREEAMPPSEQIAFQPSLAHMFTHNFHDGDWYTACSCSEHFHTAGCEHRWRVLLLR